MKKRGIIFDCDGTLVNSLVLGLESFHFALDGVGEPPRKEEVITQYFGSAADRILLSILKDQERANKAFDIYIEHQTTLAERTTLHEGVRELLDALAAKHVPMAVVTGRHTRDLEILLEPHRLSEYFVTLVADDKLQKSKPDPEGILLACQRMGLDPKDVIYVGDSVMDVQAAHRAGSTAIAVTYDLHAKPELLAKENPALMAKHPSEILKFFEEKFNRA